MTTTTTTATSLIAKHRLAIALLAALTLLGLTPSAVSAQPSDFVQCVPTEFQPCQTVDPDPDPEPGTPFVVVDDLVFCGLDDNHQNPCDEPDPDPETPFEGPNDFQICELDDNLQNPCDDDEEDPGPQILPPGENGGDGGGDGDGEEPEQPEEPETPEPGIDEPVTGDPDFTG
ncbi:MAG: hypothetical protein ACRBI6_08895 [Acidimicrobiales bacterium]